MECLSYEDVQPCVRAIPLLTLKLRGGVDVRAARRLTPIRKSCCCVPEARPLSLLILHQL